MKRKRLSATRHMLLMRDRTLLTSRKIILNIHTPPRIPRTEDIPTAARCKGSAQPYALDSVPPAGWLIVKRNAGHPLAPTFYSGRGQTSRTAADGRTVGLKPPAVRLSFTLPESPLYSCCKVYVRFNDTLSR